MYQASGLNMEEGHIKIAGQQIDAIGLNHVRKALSIIPQDSFIFSGTLRFNIDPYNEFSDNQIFETLDRFGIFDTLNLEMEQNDSETKTQNRSARTIEKGEHSKREKLLKYMIEESGKNLSTGQKQLICISRVLIKKPKILLMDEATSNIDQMTDTLIQKIIKDHFTDTTILTIAHRLKTIIEYDRIIVLDQGSLVEEGSPLDLINRGGIFADMIKENGPEYEQEMRDILENKDHSLSSKTQK